MGQRRGRPWRGWGGVRAPQSPGDAALALDAPGPPHGVCIMVLMVHSMVFGFYKFLAHSVVLLPASRQSAYPDAALWLSISAAWIVREVGSGGGKPWD